MTSTFKTYIQKLLKDLSPDTGLSGDAIVTLDKLYIIIIHKIMERGRELMIRSSKKTLSVKELSLSVSLAFNQKLASSSSEFGNNAVALYNKNRENSSEEAVSRSISAGLIFPVTRTQTVMIQQSVIKRKTDKSAVFLTAVIQYIISLILKRASELSTKDKKIRIAPRHINAAITENKDLLDLFSNVIFSGKIIYESS